MDVVSKSFEIPSVRRETVREHLFGVLEPRNFERLTVLDNVSFELREGETLGIMGRNGCGKSTLLKILCGIYTRGRRRGPGARGTHADPRAGRRLEPGARRDRQHLSDRRGHGAVAARGGIAAWTRSSRSRRSSDSRDLKLKHYSSGMASRLAYAVAFHAVREVLVLDEIFAVGDAGFRAKCEQRYRQLARTGHAVIVVSHDPRSIEVFCDRAILLEDGRILVDGPGRLVVAKYLELVARPPEE